MVPRILIVWLLLPLSALPASQPVDSICLANQSANFDHAANAKMDALTQEILTTHPFGLFSLVYPIVPEDGFPLTFDADGTVHARQFDGARWTLDNGEVRLWNSSNEVFRTFRYSAKCNTLTSTAMADGQSILIEIAIVRPAA